MPLFSCSIFTRKQQPKDEKQRPKRRCASCRSVLDTEKVLCKPCQLRLLAPME